VADTRREKKRESTAPPHKKKNVDHGKEQAEPNYVAAIWRRS